ncbi:glycosyltransferase [bacterium]|nr:MAG: glycosyltransferase [bacterium]
MTSNYPGPEINKGQVVSVGVPVYNEGIHLDAFIESLLSQRGVNFLEVIFVLSGCDDKTEESVRKYMQKEKRIKLEIQKIREGKASAINLLLKSVKGNIVIISSSDLILEPDCLKNVLASFKDPKIGMAGCHPYPIRNSQGIAYSLNTILWQLHHELCLKMPKLGELIAFRNIIKQIPGDCVTDEVYIEAAIKENGYQLCYREDAVVYNRCPVRLRDLFLQRMRVFWGHIDIRHRYAYKASSMNTGMVLMISAGHIIKNPGLIIPFVVLCFIEFFARATAACRYYCARKPVDFIWPTYQK